MGKPKTLELDQAGDQVNHGTLREQVRGHHQAAHRLHVANRAHKTVLSKFDAAEKVLSEVLSAKRFTL